MRGCSACGRRLPGASVRGPERGSGRLPWISTAMTSMTCAGLLERGARWPGSAVTAVTSEGVSVAPTAVAVRAGVSMNCAGQGSSGGRNKETTKHAPFDLGRLEKRGGRFCWRLGENAVVLLFFYF